MQKLFISDRLNIQQVKELIPASLDWGKTVKDHYKGISGDSSTCKMEVEAGRSQIWSQPGSHKTLFQKHKQKAFLTCNNISRGVKPPPGFQN